MTELGTHIRNVLRRFGTLPQASRTPLERSRPKSDIQDDSKRAAAEAARAAREEKRQQKEARAAERAQKERKRQARLRRELLFPPVDYLDHPYYRNFINPSADQARASFDVFIRNFSGLLGDELKLTRYLETHRDGQAPASDGELAEIVDRFSRDGIIALRLSASDRRAMIARTREAVLVVDQRRQEISSEGRGVEAVSGTVTHMSRPDDTYAFFADLLTRNGVFEICRQYYGFPFKLKFVNVQVNQGNDEGIAKSCAFPDGTRSKAYYLHIDSTIGALKVIIYRSERVSADTGAFRFFPGSHAILSPVERCIRKANDKAGFDAVNKDSARASFMALPPEFRFKANFGNDLLSDAIIDPLLAEERVCDSSDGDLLLFDSNGLHRGAQFQDPTSRREILQLLLVPDLDSGTHLHPGGQADR